MLCRADEQGPAGRRGLGQAIGRAVAAGLAFPCAKCLDIGRVLDPLSLVVAARMGKVGQGSGGVAVGMPDEGRLAKVPAA